MESGKILKVQFSTFVGCSQAGRAVVDVVKLVAIGSNQQELAHMFLFGDETGTPKSLFTNGG
jgi:hypothetical protein